MMMAVREWRTTPSGNLWREISPEEWAAGAEARQAEFDARHEREWRERVAEARRELGAIYADRRVPKSTRRYWQKTLHTGISVLALYERGRR